MERESMTPLHERVLLRDHLNRIIATAVIAMYDAAGPKAEKELTAGEVAALLGEDHPAVRWCEEISVGLRYRDAIAEREGWPTEDADWQAINSGETAKDEVKRLIVTALVLATKIEGDLTKAANVLRHIVQDFEERLTQKGSA